MWTSQKGIVLLAPAAIKSNFEQARKCNMEQLIAIKILWFVVDVKRSGS